MGAGLERLALWFLGAALPLLVLPQAEQAFRLPQAFALGLSTALLMLGWALQGALSPIPLGARLGLAFFAWQALAQLSSPARVWLLPSMAEQACYASLLLWASARSADPERWSTLRSALLLGAALGAVWGLAQWLGLDPLGPAGQAMGFGTRSYASLGNPNFWAGTLCLTLPFALLPALQSGRARAWLALAGLLAASLLLSETRAAWAACLLALGPALWLARPRLSWRRVLALVLALSALLAFSSVPGPHNPGGASTLKRALSVMAPGDASAGRSVMRRAAWEAMQEAPCLGWGQGRYTAAHLWAQGRLLARPEQAQTPYRYTHDAHCDPLQKGAESGWPGLLLFAGAACAGLVAAFRAREAALFMALAALLLHSTHHFPLSVVPSAAFFWLLLGRASALAAPGPSLTLRPVALACSVLGLAAALAHGRLLQADLAHHQGMNALASGQAGQALAPLALARRSAPEQPALSASLGQALLQVGKDEEALGVLRSSLEAEPVQAEALAGQGLALGRLGRFGEAEAALLKALELNPRDASAWTNLAKVRLLAGRRPEAIQALRSAQGLRPGDIELAKALRSLARE